MLCAKPWPFCTTALSKAWRIGLRLLVADCGAKVSMHAMPTAAVKQQGPAKPSGSHLGCGIEGLLESIQQHRIFKE